MAVFEREGEREAGFASALEARFAAERQNLRLEAGLAVAALLVFCCTWRFWKLGWDGFWPFEPAFLLVLVGLAVVPFALELLARWVPPRARRMERLDAELEARGALVAASEIEAPSASVLGALLRRAFARRLRAPLTTAETLERRARRRRRVVRWALLALLIWILLQLLGSYLGPRGPVPRGDTGALSGPRIAESGGEGAAEAQAREGREGAGQPKDDGRGEREREEEPPREDERSARETAPNSPLPPPPERRLEDLFVALREQANAGPQRDLWVVPLGAGDGEGPGESGGDATGGQSASAPPSPSRRFESAGVAELRRAAERAALPETLGDRERAWVERYFAALRKLP